MCGIWQSALQLQSMAPTGTAHKQDCVAMATIEPVTPSSSGHITKVESKELASYPGFSTYRKREGAWVRGYKELHVALTMHCPGECYRSTGNMTIIDTVIMHMCNLNKIFRDVLFPLIMTEHLVKTLASFYHHKDKHILCRNATLTYNS